MTDVTDALLESLDAAISLANDWSPNRAWPKQACTVMLKLSEAQQIRSALIASKLGLKPINPEDMTGDYLLPRALRAASPADAAPDEGDPEPCGGCGGYYGQHIEGCPTAELDKDAERLLKLAKAIPRSWDIERALLERIASRLATPTPREPTEFRDHADCPGCRICDKGYYG